MRTNNELRLCRVYRWSDETGYKGIAVYHGYVILESKTPAAVIEFENGHITLWGLNKIRLIDSKEIIDSMVFENADSLDG